MKALLLAALLALPLPAAAHARAHHPKHSKALHTHHEIDVEASGELHKQGERKPDHVADTARHPGHEYRTGPLQGVGTGLVQRFARAEVPVEGVVADRGHLNPGLVHSALENYTLEECQGVWCCRPVPQPGAGTRGGSPAAGATYQHGHAIGLVRMLTISACSTRRVAFATGPWPVL